ncbi:hypothetical protein [Embleya scabrispora]|uniref:hypothetical protein n=1 Tax=Embleya scabrispora TaxID=159449 RepID=UPI0003613A22|nr:hypothetical protein [Embleya scabrispora]MYS86577.1 hypothetical protein [Streptomyces sp. SID5474]
MTNTHGADAGVDVRAEAGEAAAIHLVAERAAAKREYDLARSWLARLGPREDPRELVSVASDLWAWCGWGGFRHRFADPFHFADDEQGSAAFTVVSPDTEGATEALRRAAAVFGRVIGDGCVLSRENIEDDVDPAHPHEEGTWLHSPNYVSDPEPTPAGPHVWVDTKNFLPAPMGETMLRLLTDELVASRIPAHIISGHGDPEDLPKRPTNLIPLSPD